MLDPVPTWLMKDHLESLLPSITNIINLSFTTGTFPDSMKSAIVTPLLKKTGLDPNNLKNFRPISNLSFVSKLLEKVVASRLVQHMNTHGLGEPMQSAYRSHHSTETALLRVHNDILRAVDKKRAVILVLLDLSAAFDTIDHDTLLCRLRHRLGITGTALKWFESYLKGRMQSVCVMGETSPPVEVKYGVPQGSVLGPSLFSIYTLPIGDIARRHRLEIHLYADDTQIYISFKVPSNLDELTARKRIEACIAEIRLWMRLNKLKLNDDKTEILFITTPRMHSTISSTSLEIGNTTVSSSKSARNLGIIFSQFMDMEEHVNNICRTCYQYIRAISHIRRYLTTEATERLVHALITSRLDNGNSLLFGLPSCLTAKLQKVQNTAARIITRSRKYESITPVLRQLHWLPVMKRINFKILTLTFHALRGTGPKYIRELLCHPKHPRSLRSSTQDILDIPRTRLSTYGDRAFSVCAPRLWNSLPLQLRTESSLTTFKSQLKKHLF